MPTPKLTVAHFMDHGIVAAQPATAIESSRPAVTFTATPSETSTLVMASAKNVRKIDKTQIDLARAISTAKTPAKLAATLIQARYDALGGTKGFLGAATIAVTICPDGIGYYRHFKGGSIYWSPATGAHEVHGLIRQKWAALGWERSFLGYPRTDETLGQDPKGEGRFNHFQHGSIYWHPVSGTFEVHGAILAKYRALGAEASVLGYPATDETGTPDGIGRFNHFQRGSIYWTPSTSAHEVHGLIRNFWAQHGWERNAQLGYPLTDELVPHRGIGYTSAPTTMKPIDLPFDVFKLPTPVAPPELKVVTPPPVKNPGSPAKTVILSSRVTAVSSKPKLVPVSTIKIGTTANLVARPILTVNPSILINDHKGRSDDRYSDFENGVLFWRRTTGEVTMLTPRTKSPSGTNVAFTAAQIATIVGARIRAALTAFPGATPGPAIFVGTTGYSFDGAGVHNRAHRLRVPLIGKIAGGATASLIIEVTAEISLDPIDREIVGYLTGWKLISSPGGFLGGGDNTRQLHLRLDPTLWKQFLVTKVPATKDNPIAILSVKTLPDGRVASYFEL